MGILRSIYSNMDKTKNIAVIQQRSFVWRCFFLHLLWLLALATQLYIPFSGYTTDRKSHLQKARKQCNVKWDKKHLTIPFISFHANSNCLPFFLSSLFFFPSCYKNRKSVKLLFLKIWGWVLVLNIPRIPISDYSSEYLDQVNQSQLIFTPVYIIYFK